MDTERQKQREKARPRLAPQKLPTKAFTKSAPSFHSVNNRKWTGPGRTGHSHQREAVKRPGGGKQQHLISLASAPWLPFILLFFTSLCSHTGGGREYLYQSSSAMPGQQWVRGSWRRETNIYPSDCCSSPPDLPLPTFTSQMQTNRAHWLMRRVSRTHLSTNMLLLLLVKDKSKLRCFGGTHQNGQEARARQKIDRRRSNVERADW